MKYFSKTGFHKLIAGKVVPMQHKMLWLASNDDLKNYLLLCWIWTSRTPYVQMIKKSSSEHTPFAFDFCENVWDREARQFSLFNILNA